MKLDKLLERLDYTVVQGSDSTEVTTLINDSRKVKKDLFSYVSAEQYLMDINMQRMLRRKARQLLL